MTGLVCFCPKYLDSLGLPITGSYTKAITVIINYKKFLMHWTVGISNTDISKYPLYIKEYILDTFPFFHYISTVTLLLSQSKFSETRVQLLLCSHSPKDAPPT